MHHQMHSIRNITGVYAIAETYGLPVIFSTHPRTRKKLDQTGFQLHPLVISLPPLGFFDYIKLQQHAKCVISDSGTISEESAMIKFPAVSFRTSTERPEAVDSGSIVLSGIEENEVVSAVATALSTYQPNKLRLPWEYTIEDVSYRVVRIIQSYTKIVNKVNWNK